MTEYVKNFVPYTAMNGEKGYVNMTLVATMSETGYINSVGQHGTVLTFENRIGVEAREPLEYFLGRRPAPVLK